MAVTDSPVLPMGRRKAHISTDDSAVVTSVKLTAETHRRLKIQCANESRPQLDVIAQAIEEYLAKNRSTRH